MLDFIMIVGGLVGLYLGGEWLVKGAARTAALFRVSAMVIGLTVVAMGTSAPELVVGISAATQGYSAIALGNVIGSNIANLGLILGLTGLFAPIAIHHTLLRREIPIMILVTLFALLLMLDGLISRVDGMVLLFGFVCFNLLLYYISRREGSENSADELPEIGTQTIHLPRELLRIALGIAVLALGANLLVQGSTNVARAWGISELVIGVTMVAVGTSLPELAASLAAVLRRQTDIAVGNVIGSNIANLLLILGATAFIQPIPIGNYNVEDVAIELIVMLAFAVMIYPLARDRVFSRVNSAFFLGVYLAFVVLSFAGSSAA